VKVLLVSPDPQSRELMALAVRRHRAQARAASSDSGREERGARLKGAMRDRPDVVIADEIASREGAFSLAKSLQRGPRTLRRRHSDLWKGPTTPGSHVGREPDAWFVRRSIRRPGRPCP